MGGKIVKESDSQGVKELNSLVVTVKPIVGFSAALSLLFILALHLRPRLIRQIVKESDMS
jgi:hypothetical protein